MTGIRLRFDGHIAGMGTTGGTRIVLGHWVRSPFGPVSDVMLESPGGHRLLLADTPELAEFVTATYRFDEVHVVAVRVRVVGAAWMVAAAPLRLRFTVGRRGLWGLLLRRVPRVVARSRAWIGLMDLPARVLVPGVRTRGSAGNARREWYGVHDLHPVTALTATFDGGDLGRLAAVDPPVRFGFSSVPRSPALVRVTTTVACPGSRGAVALWPRT
ncbi:hypothetical protein ACNTMW_05950 [Planosporangium sp. 12N6]|uniref:hypothetical protein n=1 Tax=Planosporangium spinosum TaxID=3402278 RepID=UPI003CF647F7